MSSSSIFDILLKYNIRFVYNIYIIHRIVTSVLVSLFLCIPTYLLSASQTTAIDSHTTKTESTRILGKGRLFFLTQYTKKVNETHYHGHTSLFVSMLDRGS